MLSCAKLGITFSVIFEDLPIPSILKRIKILKSKLIITRDRSEEFNNLADSLKKISKINKPIIFIYTSDHGESTLTGRAHDSSRYIWEMSSVPFLVYFNDEAKLKYPNLFDKINLRASQKKKIDVK